MWRLVLRFRAEERRIWARCVALMAVGVRVGGVSKHRGFVLSGMHRSDFFFRRSSRAIVLSFCTNTILNIGFAARYFQFKMQKSSDEIGSKFGFTFVSRNREGTCSCVAPLQDPSYCPIPSSYCAPKASPTVHVLSHHPSAPTIIMTLRHPTHEPTHMSHYTYSTLLTP